MLSALLAGPAAAQEQARSGWWMEAGGGYGRLRVRCATCTQVGTAHGGTVTVTLGGALSPKVVLGLAAQVFTKWEAGPREEVRSLTVVAQWYPTPGRRFFLRGGSGIVQAPVAPHGSGDSSVTVRGTGVGLTFGVGYDIPLSAGVGLSLQAASHVAALGDLSLPDGSTLQDTIAYVTRLSVAVFFR
jgi:hypothetical protein